MQGTTEQLQMGIFFPFFNSYKIMLKNITRILPFFIITLLSIGGVELLYGVAENYLFLPPGKSVVQQSAIIGSDGEATVLNKHENYQVILDRNLFQSYIQEPEKVEPVKENPLVGLETTSLDLVLMGTISGPQDRSRAIIMEKAKKKQDIYYQGDIVQGAEIKEILRGKVILTYNGKDEILDMIEASKYAPSPRAAAAPMPNRKKVVSSARPKARRKVPTRIKTRKVPPVRQPPPLEQPGSDSDSDAVDPADPDIEQDNESAEQIEEENLQNIEDDPERDSDANGRERIDN